MRILLLNYEYPPLGGGAGNATFYIGRELANMGHDISVVTSAFQKLPRRENRNGVELIRIPAGRRFANKSSPFQMSLYILSACWFLLRKRKRLNPDVVLAFLGIPSGVPALFFRLIAKTPYVVSIRGGDVPGTQPEQLAFFHAITKPLIKRVWRRAGAVVANSKGLAELASKTSPRLDIKVIPNGVDTRMFAPESNAASEQKGPLRFLSVGRASPEKNVGEALQALASVSDQSWEFHVVGDGPELEKWKKVADGLNIAHKVYFPGWSTRQDLIDIYKRSDVLIFPSTSEGMSNVVLESMAAGLCIVATQIRGNVDLIQHEENGLLYQPGDVETLKGHIRKILESAELRSRLKENSRRSAAGLTWGKVAVQYMKVLNENAKSNGIAHEEDL